MGIRKNMQINILLLIISVLFGVSFGGTYLWSEESPAQLLPTGRSLPDVIPTDEFIYITPSDANTPTFINTPDNVPQPNFNPETQSVPVGTNAENTTTKVSEIPPVGGVNISPEGTPSAEALPPGRGINISPTDIPSEDITPPENIIALPPEDIPAPGLLPDEDPVSNPSPIAQVDTPTDIPPPNNLDNAPNDYFVINPIATPPPFSKEDDTPTPAVAETLVLDQTPTPAFHTNDFISNLNGERYIQVASYTEYDTASERVQTLQGELIGAVVNKAIVYKEANSVYYRVVVGPFQLSEIGVNLYSIRKKGYKDAFTIQ